jgi:hypothetical protein
MIRLVIVGLMFVCLAVAAADANLIQMPFTAGATGTPTLTGGGNILTSASNVLNNGP